MHSKITICLQGAGKTSFVVQMLKFRDEVLSQKLDQVIYCYPFSTHGDASERAVHNLKQHFPSLQINNGLPDIKKLGLSQNKKPVMVVVDDLAEAAFGSEEVANLFSKVSQHDYISVVLITQNL